MARRKRKAKRTVQAAKSAPATPRTSPTPRSVAPRSDSPSSNPRSTATADTQRPAAEAAVVEPVAAEAVAAERVAADLDQQLASITELLRQSVSDETRLEAREQQLREREAELERRSDDLAHRRREHARRVRQHRQLANVQQTLAEQADGFTDLLAVLADTVTRQSESTLEQDREAIEDLQALAAEVDVKQQTIDCLKADLDCEQQRNRELQAELDQHLCERLFDTPAVESQAETLRQELNDAEARLAELEQQNQELATKLADHSVRGEIATSTGAVTESMSWEERKKLILQRLENEDQSLAHGDVADADAVRDELQSLRGMVQATDNEIARRDSEIAELRQLLEQQSDTVGDVAIGAAAIAGLLDQDDLVREEREKLQQIQTEWQDKLRQAEIEVSLERARLARERQEIEKRNVELKDRMLERPGGAAREEELDANGKPARKWLAKLGLDK